MYVYIYKLFLASYLLELLITNVEWASMLAELVKPFGDGRDGPEPEHEGGAAAVPQVKGLNGVSDQTFYTLFLFVTSGGKVFAFVLNQHVILHYTMRFSTSKLFVQCMATVNKSITLMSVLDLDNKKG